MNHAENKAITHHDSHAGKGRNARRRKATACRAPRYGCPAHACEVLTSGIIRQEFLLQAGAFATEPGDSLYSERVARFQTCPDGSIIRPVRSPQGRFVAGLKTLAPAATAWPIV